MKRFTPKESDILNAIIKARRDVRGHHFTDEAISEAELQTILDAGHYAPSVGYSQPWKFVVISDTKLQDAVYEDFQKSYAKSKKKFKHRPEYAKLKLDALRETQTHIAVFYHHQGGSILGQTSQARTGAYSVATAIQNMWLMARSLNIGIGWVSILKPKSIRKILGLGEAYEMVGYLCVGKVHTFLDEPELKAKGWEKKKAQGQTILRLDGKSKRGTTEGIKTILGDKAPLQKLIDQNATFMLAMSNSDTAKIPGISQAGLPGLMHLTPTLDAEFLIRGKLKSLKKLPKTTTGIPTPALITRAVHLLTPYGRIEALDLGLEVTPKIKKEQLHQFALVPSRKISLGARIDAKEVFEKGLKFGREYRCKDAYLILGESVPSGTTTATASALGLGYDVQALFSSSFRNVPNRIREETIAQALAHVKGEKNPFKILRMVGDNMLLFNAGFVLGAYGRFPLVLAGGTQMACVLLIVNTLFRYYPPRIPLKRRHNLMLCTTKWVAKDKHSDIKALLEMLDFPIHAYYADFDFSLSTRKALKRYDKGEAKEGVGAGGALMYGMLNGLSQEEITRQVEGFLG